MQSKPVVFLKAHIEAFTRKDGVVVAAHDTKVTAATRPAPAPGEIGHHEHSTYGVHFHPGDYAKDQAGNVHKVVSHSGNGVLTESGGNYHPTKLTPVPAPAGNPGLPSDKPAPAASTSVEDAKAAAAEKKTMAARMQGGDASGPDGKPMTHGAFKKHLEKTNVRLLAHPSKKAQRNHVYAATFAAHQADRPDDEPIGPDHAKLFGHALAGDSHYAPDGKVKAGPAPGAKPAKQAAAKPAAKASAPAAPDPHPHVIGKAENDDGHSFDFGGKRYSKTFKEGTSMHDGTPVAEHEAPDGHRVWKDQSGRVHADSQDEAAKYRGKK